jgi:MFS family permease
MKNNPKLIILILALGYLIDFFDLTIFAVVRVPALLSLGVQENELMKVSSLMFNCQAVGLVLGGVISGIWGDKFGRMSAIRAGILLYSIATIANTFVTTVPMFGLMRFLSGVGLAGEFAASITLLSEILNYSERGKSSAIVYSSGVLGGLLASFIGSVFYWKVLFWIGGIAGFLLLILRVSLCDSQLYYKLSDKKEIKRGSLKLLLLNKNSLTRVIIFIVSLFPFWFMAFLVNFSPEIARYIGIAGTISQGAALTCYFIGSLIGAYLFPFISTLTSSRRLGVFSALMIMVCAVSFFSFGSLISLKVYYFIIFLVGLASGYNGLLMVFAAENFGTNQRNIATSIISNFSRCSIIFMNAFIPWIVFQFKHVWIGLLFSAFIFLFLTFISLIKIKEIKLKSLDFFEKENASKF